MIKNKKTGQMYIGQSKNIEKRFKKHCSMIDIDKAIVLEGEDNFDFIIIEETSEDKLAEREQYWIQYYNTYHDDYHYNLSDGRKHNNTRNNVVYSLWDVSICIYDKRAMHRGGCQPCRCFASNYYGYKVPVGRFHDFVTCQVINQLIKEAIK